MNIIFDIRFWLMPTQLFGGNALILLNGSIPLLHEDAPLVI